jgi:hypothetical protein
MPIYVFEKTYAITDEYSVEAESEEEARRLIEDDYGAYLHGSSEPIALKPQLFKDGSDLVFVKIIGE